MDEYKELANLFSTDLLNSGIRAEISGHRLGVVASTMNGELLGIVSPVEIVENKTYSFSLVYQDHQFKLCIDNSCVLSPSYLGLQPHLGFFTLGKGFNDERKFIGDISSASFNVRALNNELESLDVSFAFSLIIVFILLYVLFKFPMKPLQINFEKNNSERSTFDWLMILRVFAWFCVFSIHSYIVFDVKPDFVFLGNFAFLLHFSAWSGVWVFFVLTGYLMGKMFISGRYELNSVGFLDFLRNRFLQIVPIYWFVILIISLFMHPEIFRPENLKILVKMLFFVYSGEESLNINGALWSLTTEMHFYFMAPFLVYLTILFVNIDEKIDLIRLIILTIFVLFFGLIVRYYINASQGFSFLNWSAYIYKPLYANIDVFLLGILANFFVVKTSELKLKMSLNFSYLALFTLISLYLFTSYVSYAAFRENNLVAFFIIALPTVTAVFSMFFIVLSESGLTKNNECESKEQRFSFLMYLGALTYPIYVWHEPILISVQKAFVNYDYLEKIIVSVLLILLLSHLTYMLIEKYFIQFKKRGS